MTNGNDVRRFEEEYGMPSIVETEEKKGSGKTAEFYAGGTER